MSASAGLRHRQSAALPTASGLDAGVQILKNVEPESDSSSFTEEEDESLPAFTPPTFTVRIIARLRDRSCAQIKELLAAIPAHCFERSALKSSLYIVQDVALLAVIVYTATYINHVFGWNGSLVDGLAGRVAQFVSWCAYAYIAGLPATGLWVIAYVRETSYADVSATSAVTRASPSRRT